MTPKNSAKTILVVDDDSTIREALQTMLRESGYETLEADDGLEAKDLIDKHHPDLVVLDMMMPRWGGFAVLEHFQNNPAAPPFIMLTAHDGAKHKAYARQIGVLDYVQKPYSMEHLLQKIERFFQGRRTHAPAGSRGRDMERRSPGSEGAARLLVAQTHKPLLDAIRRDLEEEGYLVDTADDGELADRQVRSAAYDVIILGLHLPKIDGLTLLKNWRSDGIWTDILVLTAKDATADKIQGLDLGADDYLTKPFQMDELRARLRALIRRRQADTPILRAHGLLIDTASRTVKRGAQSISLTPREFDLLHLLALHRGKVVTRSMIWRHLYDEKEPNTSNVVDVYIRYLRTKIDTPFETKLILTRWGEGYLLRGDED